MQSTLNTGKGFASVLVAPQTPSWSADDVARYFGVKRATIYVWVYRGVIPVHRTPGGRIRFVEAEIKNGPWPGDDKWKRRN